MQLINVRFHEELFGLIVTLDPEPSSRKYEGQQEISINASVKFGVGISFIFTIQALDLDFKLVSVHKGCEDGALKEGQVKFYPGPIPTRYVVFVEAISQDNEQLSIDKDFAIEDAPLPDMKLVLHPATLMSGNNTLVVTVDEMVTVILETMEAVTGSISNPSCEADWGFLPKDTANTLEIRKRDDVAYFSSSRKLPLPNNYSVTIVCQNSKSQHKHNATIIVLSRAKFVEIKLTKPVVPLNDVTGQASAPITYDYTYGGTLQGSIKLLIDFGDGNPIYTTHVTNSQSVGGGAYKKRGLFNITVTAVDGDESLSTLLPFRVGILDLFFDPLNASITEGESIRFIIEKFIDEAMVIEFTDSLTDPISITMSEMLRSDNFTKYYSIPGNHSVTISTYYDGTHETCRSYFTVLPSPPIHPNVTTDDLFEVNYRNLYTPLPASLSNMPTIAARNPVADKSSILLFEWKLSKNIGNPPDNNIWREINIQQPFAINLVVKSFISLAGFYKIELSINITHLDSIVQDYMYMEVKDEPIVAIIKGGVFRQIGTGHVTSLDASLSYDQVTNFLLIQSDENILFSWACYRLGVITDGTKFTVPLNEDMGYRSFPKCSIPAIPSTAIAAANTSSLDLSSKILFELTVRVATREAQATQVVEIVEDQPPVVAIICQWNCGSKLLTEDRTTLLADIKCLLCSLQELANAVYKWSLFEIDLVTGYQTIIPTTAWSRSIVSVATDPVFDSNGGWWKEATGYKLAVEVQIANLAKATGEYTLYTNLPPYGGSCDVTPKEGIAGETGFTFSAIDWKDEGSRPARDPKLDINPVLTYTYQQMASIHSPFAYTGGEISTPLKKLIACGTPTGECDVIAQIIDPYKGVAECKMKVKVVEFINLGEAPKHQQLDKASDVIKSLEEQMEQTLHNKDPVKIAQDAATFGTILGTMGDSLDTEEKLTDINVEDLESRDGLSGLVDTSTAIIPVKTKLEEASNKFVVDTSQALNEAVRRNDVQDPSQVEIFAKSLTSSVQSGKNFITGSSIKNAAGSARNLSLILSGQTSSARVSHDIESALQGMSDLMNSIVYVMDIDAASFVPSPEQLGSNTGLDTIEINYAADLLAKRRHFEALSKLQEAPEIVVEARQTWENMFEITKELQDPKGEFQISKPTYQMSLKKTQPEQITQETVGLISNDTAAFFSVGGVEADNDHKDLHFQVVKTKNMYTYGTNSKFITSDVIIASVESNNKSKVTMKSPTISYFTYDCQTNENEHLQPITPKFIDEDAAHLFYHQFEYSNPNGRVCMKIRPANEAVFYRLYAKVGREPNDLYYDYRVTVSSRQMAVCQEVCIPAGKLKKTGIAYIGLRPLLLSTTSYGRRKRSVSVTDPLLTPYLYGMTVTACYNWDDQQVDWIASQCAMNRNGSHVTCTCNTGKELIGAISFNFAPNTIHFGTVFSKFDIENQAAVLGVLLGLFFLFALMAIWAHYKDRKSIFEWGVFPLKDNYAQDEYFYLITVHTGLRKGAGTSSNVGFALSGDKGESGLRKLVDGVREGLPTGSVVHYVMAVPACLGSLQYLRIWHDNSGPGSKGAWYLNKVIIADLQNGDSFHFLNNGWLCPELNTLDKVINSSCAIELETFKSSFAATASRQVTDDHVWVSVFIRPERSRFSRLERVGCCLAFLLLSMITSAMFYQGTTGIDRQQPQPDLLIGPFRLSWQQLYYALAAAVITSVPILVMVIIFRRARFRVEERVSASSCGCRRRKRIKDGKIEIDMKRLVEKNEGSNTDITCLTDDNDDKETVTKEKKKNFHKASYKSLSEDSYDNELQVKISNATSDSDNGSVEKENEEVEEVIYLEPDKEKEGVNTKAKEEDRSTEAAQKDLNRLDSEILTTSRMTSCCAKMPWMKSLEREIMELDKILLIRPLGRESLDGSWPYATRYVAWLLVIASVVVSSFFVILYSMQWGKDVSQEWLSTFFLSFLQSLLVVDPIKVLLLSFLFAIFIRKLEFVGIHEINMAVVTEVNKDYGIQKKPNPPRKYISYRSALTPDELQEAALKRKVTVLVRQTLLELTVHGLLLLLVCSVCYSNRTTSDFRLQETVYNSLIAPKYTGFKYVNSTKMYYDWLENVVTPWLFPEKDYTGQSILTQDRLFTADWSLYRLGAPRLRQLRMKYDDCPSKKIKSLPCVGTYSINKEEEKEYCFGWELPLPCPAIDQLRMTAAAWYFQSALDIWGIPVSGHFTTYGGGGYLMNLDINSVVAKAILQEAKHNSWIDRQTSAVFLEFTLYNPNSDHFINVLLLAEFSPLGGVITYHTVHPFAPYHPPGAFGQYISVCEIACIVFTAVGFVYVVYEFRIHRKAAFKNFWFLVDVLLFVISTVAISMFSLRSVALKDALRKMREDPTKFVNFTQVVVWDFGFISCMGFLIALVSFRFLKLAGYSKKTMRVYEALRLSVGILPSFLLCIWLVIASFAICGMILFSSTSKFYKGYLDSLYVLFIGVLGKTGFKDTGLPPSGFYITVVYFTLFTCVVNIFLAQWFIAVLLDILTVSAQRDCPAVRSDKAKVFQLLWESFIYLFSKKNPPIETLKKNHKANVDLPHQAMSDFDDWLRRLNIIERSDDSNPKMKSFVAVYDETHHFESDHKNSGKTTPHRNDSTNTGHSHSKSDQEIDDRDPKSSKASVESKWLDMDTSSRKPKPKSNRNKRSEHHHDKTKIKSYGTNSQMTGNPPRSRSSSLITTQDVNCQVDEEQI